MFHKFPIYSAFVAVVISCCSLSAAEKKTVLGNKAPTFSKLPAVDGKTYSSSDFKDAKATVIIFTCNTCPVASAYEERFANLQKTYASKGVKVVAINVNTNRRNNFKAMKKRAQEKNFNYPYLYDASQQSAKSFGAKCTPSIYLVDGNQKVVYAGAMDNKMNPAKVTKHHLIDAIDAVLSGKAVTVSKTSQIGCGIKWKRK